MTDDTGATGRIFRELGITRERLMRTLQEVRGSQRVTSQHPEATYEALERYGRDLTKLASEGKLDPVIGRDEELRRTIQVLSRRTKNNPVRIGEPGVGKTAIVEGLAQRIVRGDVPESLKDRRIVALDMGALVAAALMPGACTEPAWALRVGLSIDDYWPFLTSMFLHGGWMHIIGNMWTLWIFGDNVEDRMGPLRFVCFYLLCGIAAGLIHWFTNLDSTLPTVGAFGAIAGVLGAYFFLFPYARVIVLVPVFFLPFFFELPALVYLGFWALSQVWSGTLALVGPGDVGGVAWWAHVGGFMAGIVLHFFFVQRGDTYRQPWRDEYAIESAWVPVHYWGDKQ